MRWSSAGPVRESVPFSKQAQVAASNEPQQKNNWKAGEQVRFHARSLLGAYRIVKRWGMIMPDVFERAQKGG
jgi:hypothetical protein